MATEWRRSWFFRILIGLLLLLAVGPLFWGLFKSDQAEEVTSATGGWRYSGSGQLPDTFQLEAFLAEGPRTCIACHSSAYEDWSGSHHDLANRTIVEAEDMKAFKVENSTYEKDGEHFRLYRDGDDFFLEVTTTEGQEDHFPVVGLLGVDPLYNFIVVTGEGRLQATTLSWDVHKEELFDSFDGEERLRGDYGHWMGQGLNWNANCAWCHMTDFNKNLDPKTLGYESDWFSHGVTCRQCHAGTPEHAQAAAVGNENSVLPMHMTIEQTMDNCYACHSRRAELTANAFQPGDLYADHFSLSLPDQPGLYFADGQILDEVFAGASFQLSAMGHAGVTCMDCHDPHSLKLKLPSMNNSLCQRCHDTGLMGAQIIEPAAHSFHDPMLEGGRCVDCHMPQRTYMARDPRHDHNFPIPDPHLTLELGVPNACSQCHDDRSVEWAAEWVDTWYGEDFHERREPLRERARLFAGAHAGEGDAAAILAYLEIEPNPVWRASLMGLLGYAEPTPSVMRYLETAASDENVFIREQAARQLAGFQPNNPVISELLQDEVRAVRMAVLLRQPDAMVSDARLQADWTEYMETNADRAQVAFMLAREALNQGQRADMHQYLDNAISIGPNEVEIWRQAAIMRSEGGDQARAEADLHKALELEPDNPSLHWTLALFYNEVGRPREAIEQFQTTLQLDPDYPRAAYNLVVLLAQQGDTNTARRYLEAALQRDPQNRDLQQLRAWLERQ